MFMHRSLTLPALHQDRSLTLPALIYDCRTGGTAGDIVTQGLYSPKKAMSARRKVPTSVERSR